MAIFFAAALIILAGVSSSVQGVARVQTEAQAQDLAVSLLSEVQMGLVEAKSDGPNGYEDPSLADWSWQIVVEPYDQALADVGLPEFRQVTVVVRNEQTGRSTSLSTLMTDESAAAANLGGIAP